jgi:hypothetical protein
MVWEVRIMEKKSAGFDKKPALEKSADCGRCCH